MNSIKTILGFLFLSAAFLYSCGVQFRNLELYDAEEQVEPVPPPKSIEAVVSPVIFDGDPSDAWGLEKDACKDIRLSKGIGESGGDVLDLSWNRSPDKCEWAGMGIGWEGYLGKDLSPILNMAAIQMRVRSKSGTMYGLPIVLTLEDYTGGQSYAYTGNGYFDTPLIEEEWQNVTVPLTAFDIEKDGLDATNVKSLNLELQAAGNLLIDQIYLVPYEPVEQEPWIEEPEMPDYTALPQVLFDEAFANGNGWGMMQDKCQQFQVADGVGRSGTKGIQAAWTAAPGCNELALGVSWSKWNPVDLTNALSGMAVDLYVKPEPGYSGDAKIRVRIEDFNFAGIELSLPASGNDHLNWDDNSWQRITVPLRTFTGSMDLSIVKSLVIRFEGKGKVLFDDIRLVNAPQP